MISCKWLRFIVLCFLLIEVFGFSDFGEDNLYLKALKQRPWKSVKKYIEVRHGVFLFYWFYYADGTSEEADTKPLIIWIQGGPGLAATGIAHFAEIGPFKMDMTPRNHTWVNGRNLLLIDHPVGAGFSYATKKSLYVKTDKQAAIDLFRAIKIFLRQHKAFEKAPTYIFGQSYGGKITPRLGWYLHSAIERNHLRMNFKGIGIGGGWVDPKESSLMQPQFLYDMGVIDQKTYLKTMKIAKTMGEKINNKQYLRASYLDDQLFVTLTNEAGMEINFNNINQESPYPSLDRLAIYVNKYIKPTLSMVNQNFVWKYINDDVFQGLNESFVVPSTKFLESLLNKTQLRIAVYNGNMDVVTPLAGAANWVHKLKWDGAEGFKEAKRIPIRGKLNGFFKVFKNLSFWGVFKAGHWVPEDNPEAMEHILDHVIHGILL